MHFRNAREVEALETPHGEIVYELCGDAAGGAAGHSLARIVIPPGKASRPHLHPTAEESYYILAGAADLTLGDQVVRLGPGDAVVIPPGTAHHLRNGGSDDLVLLAVCVPPWRPDNSVYLD